MSAADCQRSKRQRSKLTAPGDRWIHLLISPKSSQSQCHQTIMFAISTLFSLLFSFYPLLSTLYSLLSTLYSCTQLGARWLFSTRYPPLPACCLSAILPCLLLITLIRLLRLKLHSSCYMLNAKCWLFCRRASLLPSDPQLRSAMPGRSSQDSTNKLAARNNDVCQYLL